MSEGRKFSKESSLYVVGEFISKAFTFLLLPVYTSYLSLEDFAVFSFVSMIWPVVLILLGKSFSAYLLRGYYEYEDKNDFSGTLILFSMGLGLGLTLILHLSGPRLVPLVFRQLEYKPYLQYGVFFGLFRLFFNHVITLFRARRQPQKSVQLAVVQFAAHAAAVAFAIFILRADLLGILRAQLAAYAAVSVLYILYIKDIISFRVSLRYIRPALVFIVPLYIHAAASWVVVYISRIFIENYLPLAEVSVYAAATQLSFILTVINNGLNQAWSPFVYANAEKEDFQHLFAVNARKVFVAVLVIGAGMVVFSRELLTILGKAEYLRAYRIFPLLVGGYLFQMLYFIYVAVIVYHKKTAVLPAVSIVSGLFCVIINMVLIPVWGLAAAALSTFVAFNVMFWCMFIYAKKYVRARVVNLQLAVFIIVLVIITSVFYIFSSSFTLLTGMVIKTAVMLGVIRLLEHLKLLRVKEFIGNLTNRRIY